MTERTFNTIAIIFSLALIVALCIYEYYRPPKPPKVPIRTTQADAGEVMTRPPMPGRWVDVETIVSHPLVASARVKH